ncbi:MAG TPA: HEAT repeat domain-containing protein, partial [Sphingomicrobium sp.]|nr:HEAT repeat domain-containing protein [Sphingomicrobium sp.]
MSGQMLDSSAAFFRTLQQIIFAPEARGKVIALGALAILLACRASPALSQQGTPHQTPKSGHAQVPTLKQVMAHPLSERASIAEAMGNDQAGAGRSAPVLVKMLEDKSSLVRAEAAASLARLGEGAFPAMIAALRTNPVVTSDPDGPDRHVGSYLSWAFANSIADPGPALLAFEKRSRDTGNTDGPDPAPFVSTSIGMRGENALPYATTLLGSSDDADRELGLNIATAMGKAASPEASAIAKLVSDGDLASEAITALGQMGDEGQIELARLFAEEKLKDVRGEIAQEMHPGPRSLAAQLKVAQWSDSEARSLAIQGLLGQDEIPAAATPVLLDAARKADTRGDAFLGLSRAPLAPDQEAEVRSLAETELTRVLSSAETYDSSTAAQRAIRALVSTGPAGRDVLRSRLTAPSTHVRACQDAWPLSSDTSDEGPSAEWLSSATAMVRDLCKDVQSYWRDAGAAAAPSPVLAPAAIVEKIVGEQGDVDRQKLCSEAVTSNPDIKILAAERLRSLSWSDLSGIGYDCHELFSGPVTIALARRMRVEQGPLLKWADEGEDSIQELLNSMSVGEADRPADWSAVLAGLAMSRNQSVRLWALGELGNAAADPATTAILAKALKDKDKEIASAAAGAVLQQQSKGPVWEEAAVLATRQGLEADIDAYADKVDYTFEPPAPPPPPPPPPP